MNPFSISGNARRPEWLHERDSVEGACPVSAQAIAISTGKTEALRVEHERCRHQQAGCSATSSKKVTAVSMHPSCRKCPWGDFVVGPGY